MIHELRIWPEFFVEIFEGRKTFEVRNNDRNFQPNDVLLLREFHAGKGHRAQHYTGREMTVHADYVYKLPLVGNYVGISISSPVLVADTGADE